MGRMRSLEEPDDDSVIGSSSKSKRLRFPLKFRVFLRLVVKGKRSYGERLPIFKKYWCSKLEYFATQGSDPPVGSDNKTSEGRLEMTLKIIEKCQREGVDENFFITHLHGIERWRKEMQVEQRRNAAKSRWSKHHLKPLDPKSPTQK
jgi:hypothetical protein